MRPRKKWEPEYRFGGNRAHYWDSPRPLGTTNGLAPPKKPKPKGKKR